MRQSHLISVDSRHGAVVVPLLVLLLSLMAGMNLVRSDMRFWLLLAAGVAGLVVLARYRAAILLMLVSVFLLSWLSEAIGLLPRQATWIEELVLIALSLRLMFEVARRRDLGVTPIDIALGFLVLIAVVSTYLNSEKPLVLIVGLRNYFKFLPLFYAVRWLEFDEAFLKRVLQVLTVIAFLQVPVAVSQRVLFPAGETGDVIGGTLGANTSGTLTLFLLCIVSLAMGAYLNGLVDVKKLLALVAVFLVPMVINETKITFILFPLLALFFFLRREGFRRGVRAAVVPLAACAAMLTAGIFAYNALYPAFYSRGEGLFTAQQFKYLTSERTKSGGLNRISQLRFADETVRKDPVTGAIGVGPGNASDSFFDDGEGHYYKQYRLLQIDRLLGGRMLWEYGYVGLSLFIVVFVQLWLAARRIAREDEDAFRRSVALGFQGILLVALVASFYSPSVVVPVLGFIFWFLAGYVQRWQTEKTGDVKAAA